MPTLIALISVQVAAVLLLAGFGWYAARNPNRRATPLSRRERAAILDEQPAAVIDLAAARARRAA